MERRSTNSSSSVDGLIFVEGDFVKFIVVVLKKFFIECELSIVGLKVVFVECLKFVLVDERS